MRGTVIAMNNFVLLSCPSCGASVNVNIGAKTGKCEYCESEFACQDTLNSPQPQDYQKHQNEKQLQGDDW